jgi:hypothetical protein
MLAEAPCTSLGCTSKTCSPRAHFIQQADTACRVLFWRPHTQPLLLAYPTAKVGSVCTPENSQPVIWLMKPLRSKLRSITGKGIVCETPRFLTHFPLQGNLGASSEESPD